MDVLDPEEVAGHPLTAPDGPGSKELAAALEKMFSYEKVAALGIASLPHGENDKDKEATRNNDQEFQPPQTPPTPSYPKTSSAISTFPKGALT